ncbi:hypothetical protein D3C87_1300190 [compost metagenome]
MNWMLRRSACSAGPCIWLMFWPANSIVPLWASTRRSSERPVVDLPQPDSPTSASVSPGYRSKLTCSTACTRRVTRPNRPPGTSKRVTRSRTRRIGSAPAWTVSCGTSASGAATSFTCTSGNLAGRSLPVIAPSFGTAESSARVYGWAGAWKTSSEVPSSTFSPRYITSTRSATSATTPMSWVMKTTPMSISAWRLRISCRISAWMVTSSAVVGSSAISSAGLHDSAMAIITRWRMPPESWCGKRSSTRRASGMRTSSSMRSASARAAALFLP